MFRTIREAREDRAAAKAVGKEGRRRISSWIKVFRGDANALIPRDEAKLAADIGRGNYSCVGRSHSYNGVQIIPGVNAMIMCEGGLSGLAYDAATGIAKVGASVSVKECKEFLLKHDRRLFNSGNYMAQTVVGAMMTGTHGFGERAVMADAIQALTFLDGEGRRVRLQRGDPDFPYVALSFGTIGPIIEIEIATAPIEAFISTSHIDRLSKLDALKGDCIAANWVVLPYSNPNDPMMMLHTLGHCAVAKRVEDAKKGGGLFGFVARAIIKRYQWLDKWVPPLRRPMQRFLDRLNITQRTQIQTDPRDLDYLYDPKPGLASERAPDILHGMFSTTYTGYNLAFFVPLEKAVAVVKFIMREADGLRDLGFFLKGVISVREIPGRSDVVFAANHEGPMAAVDLFADPRDYAWLERLQRQVLQYEPSTRPHFGKSALMPEFRDSLGQDNLDRLMAIHERHYPGKNLMFSERVRAFLDVGRPLKGEPAADAMLA